MLNSFFKNVLAKLITAVKATDMEVDNAAKVMILRQKHSLSTLLLEGRHAARTHGVVLCVRAPTRPREHSRPSSDRGAAAEGVLAKQLG